MHGKDFTRARHPHRPRSGSGRPRSRLAAALLAAVTVMTALLATGATGTAALAASGGPVLDQNFPDPDVLRSGDTYHAYATNGNGRNIQHATSTDLANWTVADADPLPDLGSWAKPERSLVWAPEVFDNGAGFTMYYVARDAASDRQCVGVALSGSPDGPFEPTGGAPLVCPADQGGAIDPATYTENGQRYLLWKNDGNCCGQTTWLYLQPVSADGTQTTGGATQLIKNDQGWENGVIEAPTLVKHGGHYVLFYSGGSYAGDGYATSYAVATSLTGPYTKAAAPLMTTDSFGGTVRGPGGQDVVAGPDGRDRVVFHGWSADYSRRSLYVADLGWANDYPVVNGSKVIYQAENATVNHAVVRDASGRWTARPSAPSTTPTATWSSPSTPHGGQPHTVRALRQRLARRRRRPGRLVAHAHRQRHRRGPGELPVHRVGQLAEGRRRRRPDGGLEHRPARQGRLLRGVGQRRDRLTARQLTRPGPACPSRSPARPSGSFRTAGRHSRDTCATQHPVEPQDSKGWFRSAPQPDRLLRTHGERPRRNARMPR
ncbi:glycoside hydrolase family 43 protein [Streptomyces sp. M19]